MRTRGMDLTSRYEGKNINMDATAKPGEIQDAVDEFRTVADNNYTWGIEPGPTPTTEEVTETFVGDGETVAFPLNATPIEIEEVTVEGEATEAYTASGAVVTFTEAPADEAEIKVKYLKEI